MAYDHQRIESVGAASPVGGDTQEFFPGYQPFMFRAAGVLVTTAVNVARTVEFFRRPTAGSATGQVSLGIITVPTSAAAGDVVYKDDFVPTKILPGEALAAVSSAVTTGATRPIPSVTASWDQPGGNSNMIKSV